MVLKIFISFFTISLLSFGGLVCGSKKVDLHELDYKLPDLDTLNTFQCVVRYKNTLYDNNAALTFSYRIVYIEPSIIDWVLESKEELSKTIQTNLNAAFYEQGISFRLSEYLVKISDYSMRDFNEHWKEFEEEGVITIIVYVDRKNAVYNGIASGVPGTVIGVVQDRISKGTLPHEIGHILGLFHIFERDDTDGLSLHGGDRICDTPAFNIMDSRSMGCNYTGNRLYKQEDLKVIIPNYLNYSNDTIDCRSKFTPIQGLSMRWYIENYPPLYNCLN